MIEVLYQKFGHPQKRDFLRMMKLAGASRSVLNDIDRDFHSESKEASKKPGNRMKG